ncbi:substrate-binding domain-containing protein [Kushneria sp. AK178]
MPIMIKRTGGLLCMVLLSLLFTFPAARADSPHDKRDDELVIGMSFQTLDNVYFVTLQRALQEAINDMGATLLFTDAGHDLDSQLDNIRGMLERDIDILLLAPVDPAGLQPAVTTAHEAGVTVIAIGARAGGPIDGLVGSNNLEAGRQACHYLAEQLDGKGEIALLDGPMGEASQQRIEGCQKALADFEGIEVVDRQNGHEQRATALSATETLLKRHPDLAGIFSVNDTGSLGALVAIQTAGRDVKLAGVDGSPEAVRMLTRPNSPLIAMAAQHPADIATRALALAVQKYHGEQGPDDVSVAITLVTADNAPNFLW